MTGPEDFTRIVVWQKSQALAAAVARLVASLPENRASDIIGAQVLRSAGSVPANIAEGYGRYSQAAYRHHLSIARGSLFETQSWLHLLWRTDLLSEEEKTVLVAQCQEAGKLITIRMKSLSDGKQSYAREEGPEYVLDDS